MSGNTTSPPTPPVDDLSKIIERLYETKNYPAWLLRDLSRLLTKMGALNAR